MLANFRRSRFEKTCRKHKRFGVLSVLLCFSVGENVTRGLLSKVVLPKFRGGVLPITSSLLSDFSRLSQLTRCQHIFLAEMKSAAQLDQGRSGKGQGGQSTAASPKAVPHGVFAIGSVSSILRPEIVKASSDVIFMSRVDACVREICWSRVC